MYGFWTRRGDGLGHVERGDVNEIEKGAERRNEAEDS